MENIDSNSKFRLHKSTLMLKLLEIKNTDPNLTQKQKAKKWVNEIRLLRVIEMT